MTPERRSTSSPIAARGTRPASPNQPMRAQSRRPPRSRHHPAGHDDRRDPSGRAADLGSASAGRHAAVLVPGPSTYWSKPGSRRTAVVGRVAASSSSVLGEDQGVSRRPRPRPARRRSQRTRLEAALAEPAAGDPVRERLHRGRPVRAEVGADGDRRRLVRLGQARPAWARRLGRGERHPRPHARPEDEVALPGDRLQQRAPARSQPLGDALEATPAADGLDQLLAGERPLGDRLANDAPQALHLLRRHAEVPDPARSLPRAAGGHERQEGSALLGREEVERAAHRPGLDQAAIRERERDLPASRRLAPHADGELRRRRDLGLHGGEPANDAVDRQRPIGSSS